jgi:hypothetical protein
MPELMTDDELRHTALSLLESELGPVQALRFLALVRHEPFDYQMWRDRHLDGLSVDELFRRMRDSEMSS